MKINHHAPGWRRLVRTLARLVFRWAENNDDQCMASNGEQWLLRSLISRHAQTNRSRPFVLIDAGANMGDYTKLALQEATAAGTAAEVHAFEPSPHNLQVLRASFAGEHAVKLVGAAVGAHEGEGTLFAGGNGSGHASLVERAVFREKTKDEMTVPLLTLARYVTDQSVPHIDLLKLDIEGAELAALRGLGDKLVPSFVDVIQFEYGGTALDAGTSLRELNQLLVGRGFAFAKLFPRSLEVRPYRDWMENYAFANYVALAPRWLRTGGETGN